MPDTTPPTSAEATQMEGSVEISREVWRNHTANPFNWPRSKKWRVTMVTATVTFLVSLNATAVATPSHIIAEEFHVSYEDFPNSFWPVTVWSTGAAVGPLCGWRGWENFGTGLG